MSERLEAAFVFGSLGNLIGALGEGWSVEDNYAWAVGERSGLALPLPGDEGSYVLRLTVHPLVHPGVRESQRLRITAGDVELGTFDLLRQDTIELRLPVELTRQHRHLDLLLLHPDAARPSDFKETPDSRWLTLCFHSGALVRETNGLDEEAEAPDLIHAVIAGSHTARQIFSVMSNLPLLQNRVVFHRINSEIGLDAAVNQLPPRVLHAAQFYWQQSGAGQPTTTAELRGMLPETCEVRRFASPRMTALWPLQGADPRLIHEPGRYDSGRYPFSDRVGASLANMWLPDDVMLLAYESMAEKEMSDLDAHLEADLASWRRSDAANDVCVADFILDNFRRRRLFSAPDNPTAAVLRHIIDQLVAAPEIATLVDPIALQRELDFLLTGYVGRWEELPIHPHVARHFDLSWWQPDMRYRWFGNRWTFHQYALDYIRWTPWRP